MNYATTVNPFFAARMGKAPRPPRTRQVTPIYARLPLAPRTASPVPHLTSLYHFESSREYGDRRYPGNCGGDIIKDLLTYFQPGLVFDPMSGSGTCADVCRALNIPCLSFDIHQGFDACDPNDFSHAETFDFIWAHPAYWRIKLYADDPRDLSRSPTLDHFLRRYGQFIRNCRPCLEAGRQACHPHGRHCRPRRGLRSPHLPHQAACLRGRAAAVLHRHHPLRPRSEQFQKGLPVVVHPDPA